MSEYARYPLVMTHPGHQPAKIRALEGTDLKGKFTDYQGTSERLPPITVTSEDQEEYHAAQGYRPAGEPNPAAFEAAITAPIPDDYEVIEYPKWVNGVLFQNKDDEDAYDWPTQDAAHEEPLDQAGQIAALQAQLAALTAPKNRGGRPRKQPVA